MGRKKKDPNEPKMPMKKHLHIYEFMCKTGGVSYKTLQDHFKLGKTALKNFTQLCHIEEKPELVVDANGKETIERIFYFNREGRNYCISKGLTIEAARYTSYKHHLGLEQELIKLLEQNIELKDIKNEHEAAFLFAGSIKEAQDKGYEISVADFTVKTEEGYKVVEVLTKNYKSTQKKAHENYAKHVIETENYVAKPY